MMNAADITPAEFPQPFYAVSIEDDVVTVRDRLTALTLRLGVWQVEDATPRQFEAWRDNLAGCACRA